MLSRYVTQMNFFFRVVFFFENLPGEGEGEEENL